MDPWWLREYLGDPRAHARRVAANKKVNDRKARQIKYGQKAQAAEEAALTEDDEVQTSKSKRTRTRTQMATPPPSADANRKSTKRRNC